MKLARGIRIAALVGLAFFAAGLSARSALAQPRPQVHITYSENMYAAMAVVAIEKGFLAAQGLDVKHDSEGTATEVLQSLVGGSTDFGVASTSRMIAIGSRKLPVKAVALNSYGFTSSVVVPKKDQVVRSMAD